MDRGLGARFRPAHSLGSCATARGSRHRAADRGLRDRDRDRYRVATSDPMRIILVLLAVSGIPRVLVGQRWERQVQERVQRTIAAVGASPGLPVVRRSGMLNTD